MFARQSSLVAAVGLTLAATPRPGTAATLRVERDGSGGFTTLQAAVDASFPDDVILIGPGRYDDIHEVQHSNGVFYEVVDVHTGGLSFRGTSRGEVIIGPAQAAPTGVRWDGVVATRNTGHFTVENVTLENVYVGVGFIGTDLTIRDCSFRNGFNGVQLAASGVATFERCSFANYGSAGLGVSDNLNAQATIVSGCEFSGCGYGIDAQTNGTLVTNCTFRDGDIGLQFSFSATGAVEDCWFGVRRTAFGLLQGSRCTLSNCVLAGAEENLLVGSYCHVTGSGNILTGGSYSTITCYGTMELHDCHILQGSGPRVLLKSPGSPYTIDLTRNYWGTTDAQQIAASIIDHNDNPLLAGTVLFEPFLGQPVANDTFSFGGLKGRYRGDAR